MEVNGHSFNEVEVVDQGIVKNANPTLGRDVDAYVLEFAFTHEGSEYRHALAITPPERMNDRIVYESYVRQGKLIVLAQAGVL